MMTTTSKLRANKLSGEADESEVIDSPLSHVPTIDFVATNKNKIKI